MNKHYLVDEQTAILIRRCVDAALRHLGAEALPAASRIFEALGQPLPPEALARLSAEAAESPSLGAGE